MREFINIVEAGGDTVTLYRGDNSSIDAFDISKTDQEALLGVGIYLTDSLEVAKDYTIKERGDESVVYRSKAEVRPDTPQKLTAEFIQTLANPGVDFRRNTPGELDNKIQDIKRYWQSEYHKRTHGLSYDDREAKEAIQAEIQDGFQKEKSAVIRKAVEQAKAEFKKMRPELRIVRLTTGEYVFTKKERAGKVSVFEVPKDYVARCLDVERPLPDDLLPIVKAAFARAHHANDPEGQWDLRFWNPDDPNYEKMGNSFDAFIDGFKKHGSRYAWTDVQAGGDGKNPSLDFIWNGTHSGYHVFQNDREKQMALAKALQAKGYVGYFYDGGIRMAGTQARGGGGIRHNAYVFWDDKKINSFRKEDISVSDDQVDDFSKGMRAKKVYP
jgi:hypothetical protein